jgi:hypothetical protein
VPGCSASSDFARDEKSSTALGCKPGYIGPVGFSGIPCGATAASP